MNRNICRAAAGILAAVLLSSHAFAAPNVSAKSAVVSDAATGRILYTKDADRKSLIASTTKIMTGLLVAERCDLDSRVAIRKEAVGIEGSSMYLREGEVLSIRELLYGLLLRSGNDAAAALAIFCGGTTENFVHLMNAQAQKLGLGSTHFANPCGLDDDGNYSTAKDLAKLAACAMDNDIFHEIVSTKSVTVGNRLLTNHNKLLWRYDGAVGVKTGYTKAAGRILVSAAERGGRRLIAVTISDPCDWADHTTLLDYGFSAFESRALVAAGSEIGAVPVLSGTAERVAVRAAEDLYYPMAADENAKITLLLHHFVYAPVAEGGRAGFARVEVDGREVAKVPLVWSASAAKIKRENILDRLSQALER